MAPVVAAARQGMVASEGPPNAVFRVGSYMDSEDSDDVVVVVDLLESDIDEDIDEEVTVLEP